MNELKIRVLTSEDWVLYKSVRLESLRDSPDSFGSTYEQGAALTDSEWQSHLDLKSRAFDALPLIAEMDGQPIGLAWCLIHRLNLKVAHIYQMWVSPALRGNGIATLFLRKIQAWAIGKGCDLIELAVTTSNEVAVHLYRSSGFVAKGQLEKLRVGSALMVQPMVMELNSAA